MFLLLQVHILIALFGLVLVVPSSCSYCSKLVARVLVIIFLMFLLLQTCVLIVFFNCVLIAPSLCSSVVLHNCVLVAPSLCSSVVLPSCILLLQAHVLGTQSLKFFENHSMFPLGFLFFALCFGLCFLALWV
jgi:hypothetical protein